jgi:hypothetical protein
MKQYEYQCDREMVPMVSGAEVAGVQKTLAVRGAEGWELVSAVGLTSGSEVLLFFRREVKGQEPLASTVKEVAPVVAETQGKSKTGRGR